MPLTLEACGARGASLETGGIFTWGDAWGFEAIIFFVGIVYIILYMCVCGGSGTLTL